MANLKIRTNSPKSPPRKKNKVGKKHKINKFELNITKAHLVSNSGTLKKKTKHNLKLMNDILKSELMVRGSSSKVEQPKQPVSLGVNNNDYQQIDSQSTGIVPHSSKKNKSNTITENTKSAKCKNQKTIPTSKPRKEKQSKKKKINSTEKINKDKQDSLTNLSIINESLDKSPIMQYECDYCKKTYENKSSLQKHITYIHLNLKPYICHHCHKGFRQKCNLKVHLVSKHIEHTKNPKIYICDHCDLSFLLKENLSLHICQHTKKISFYKCAFCDIKFSNDFRLREHEKKHLKTSRYKCNICGEGYNYRSTLAYHVKSHLNIKDFICHYCGKEFLRPNSIRRHVEICHSGFRIQCPICFKKLKGHLTEHLRTHENSKPHKCPDCGQRFTQSTQLTVHRRSHTGAKPYSCRICGQHFSHSNAMLLHFRRHTGEKPFPCAMCPMSFSQIPHMKNHMRKIHGKSDAYKCQKCLLFFKLKKELDSHNKTCKIGEKEMSKEEKIKSTVDVPEIDSVMSLSRMRFLIALLLTMVASKSKLRCLGFNKRLIDDLLMDSLVAMGHEPCRDESLSPLKRLKINIDILLKATIPTDKMKKFQVENKTTEELLELLTDDKKSCKLSYVTMT